MSGRMETLRVVAQIAFRNLFASRLKTMIVGGIIFFGALLVVVGSSLVDSIDRSMSRSICFARFVIGTYLTARRD